MTTRRLITCDGCGKELLKDSLDKNGQLIEASGSWPRFMTSRTMPANAEGNFPWRSAGWDFCLDCGRKAFIALAAIGAPNHTSMWDEDESGALLDAVTALQGVS